MSCTSTRICRGERCAEQAVLHADRPSAGERLVRCNLGRAAAFHPRAGLQRPGTAKAQHIYQEVMDYLVGAWPDEDRRWRVLQNYYFNCIRDCDPAGLSRAGGDQRPMACRTIPSSSSPPTMENWAAITRCAAKGNSDISPAEPSAADDRSSRLPRRRVLQRRDLAGGSDPDHPRADGGGAGEAEAGDRDGLSGT